VNRVSFTSFLEWNSIAGSQLALRDPRRAWADLCELQIVPVVEDGEAGAVASKLFGK
jgi:hypothetical protein